jgi:hypothetical protein
MSNYLNRNIGQALLQKEGKFEEGYGLIFIL